MYFIDVQGTLIGDSDKLPIQGSLAFVDKLNKDKIPYMVVTNNTKKAPAEFLEYLNSLGFDFGFDKYIDPLTLLESRVDKNSVAAYGSQEFLKTILDMQYVLDFKQPKTVLIATKESFTAQEYSQMIEFLLGGASLVGMHQTALYAKNSKRYPGVGAILAMLKFATNIDSQVVGKPSASFYEEALKKLRLQQCNTEFEDVTMISDDVIGDLNGAKEMGMRTIFVTSGKYKSEDEIIPYLADDLKPDYIYSDMQDVLQSHTLERT